MNTRTSRPLSGNPSGFFTWGNGFQKPPSDSKVQLCRLPGSTLILCALLILLVAQAACVTTGPTTRTTGVPYDPAGPLPAPTAEPGCPPPIQIPPLALPAEGPGPNETLPTGSIWTPASFSMFQDLKAKRVGDTLTITVSEKSDASKTAKTTTGRAKDNSADINFAGLTAGGTTVLGPMQTGYTGKSDNNFKGAGVTSKTDTMTAYMSATVIDVMPNGNLLIRGSRWTKVNDELQQMVLEGVVRPIDISHRNEILSQRIADAKIFIVGKGPVSTYQRPGWLGQLFDIINPF
jgi:flagellar L-ring protein FlgH